ncbi:MAG TPA: hypothetical protein PLK00_06085 [Candidatus Hydrogenedentes bacterium]|nr:hypothetical protein [Candidatus Hydrogenedentota bacterium]
MAHHSLPMAFTPPAVYVLDAVWENPAAARRAEGLCNAFPNIAPQTFSYADLPSIVVEQGFDKRVRMGTLDTVPPPALILGLFRFDREAVARDTARMQSVYAGDGVFPFHTAAGGNAFTFFCSELNEIRPNPQHMCRPQWRIHQGDGCPHQCAYCDLGKFLISHVNTEEYIERLGDLIRRNPWQRTWLYDDIMDVLTLEPELNTLAPLMRFFERTRDCYLILHTKSDRVHGLIEANAPHNTIVVWSLSGPTQSTRLERIAGTTDARIDAARRCEEAGIQIRYKFKPIVPVRRWREEAEYTIGAALERTHPDNLSMTTLMWSRIEDVLACIPMELLEPAFVAAAEEAREELDGLRYAPFPHHVRETIYRHYLKEIRARNPEIPVTISTESLGMWKAMGGPLGFTPDDYVCGCGAGAIPGKKRLDTNPWQDARAAVCWDGADAVPGCE